MKHFFIGVLFICYSAVNAETLLPPAFNATFDLHKSGLTVAQIQYNLTHKQPSLFKAHTTLSGLASIFSNDEIIEESSFNLTPASPQLIHYRLKQTGKENKNINSVINWQQKNITTTINRQAAINNTFTNTLWDKNSVLLALMVHAGNKYKSLTFTTLDEDSIKEFKFDYIGTKDIELDNDEWKTTSIWQRKNNNKKIIFYLDPKDHYIPLKIEEYRNQRLRATLWLTELNWYE